VARIAVGGFHHETNTFAPLKATFRDFEQADGHPALSQGDALFTAVDGVNLPITGAVAELRGNGHELVPLLWCSAVPSAEVTQDAYERIVATLLETLERELPVDGIYLCLHGAMVAEHLEDGEGELLRRVRTLVGNDVPIAASLDLHTNLTHEMFALSDVLDAYHTYPHVDMVETGRRAATHLNDLLNRAARYQKAFRKAEFLVPLNWGCTFVEPAQSLYARRAELEADAAAQGVRTLSLAMGFPLADIAEVGPAVVAYGADRAATESVADAMVEALANVESEFNGRLLTADEAVAEALRQSAEAKRPIVLADTQDNPGGGGPSDTTGLLKALISGGAAGAVLAILWDPEVAARAHEAGEGALMAASLGAKSGVAGSQPVGGAFKVLKVGDGRFTGTGPMWRGARIELGPMALLEISGVRVIVSSVKMQAADQSIFRHLGIEPAEETILALKSSVHFRADFQPIAEDIILVEAPGPCYADPAKLTFLNVRPGVRLRPGEG
jgi:microcystin degradation protein MlrC